MMVRFSGAFFIKSLAVDTIPLRTLLMEMEIPSGFPEL